MVTLTADGVVVYDETTDLATVAAQVWAQAKALQPRPHESVVEALRFEFTHPPDELGGGQRRIEDEHGEAPDTVAPLAAAEFALPEGHPVSGGVSIHYDGTVNYFGHYQPDAHDRAWWDALGAAHPPEPTPAETSA